MRLALCVNYLLFAFSSYAIGAADPFLSVENLKSLKALNPEAKAQLERYEKNPKTPTVLFFWAEWCPYCKSELLQLSGLQKRPELRDVNFILVSVDETEAGAMKGLKEGPTGLAYFHSSSPELRNRFKVRRLPLTVINKPSPELTVSYSGFSMERWANIKKRIYAAAGQASEEE